ncbi:MAG: hypothetical protein LBP87_06110 [Planctomycetaceae bacterium]|jgi:hypothetical protein|nr:hypothetical protein [Planctomycetaceae bacterium]
MAFKPVNTNEQLTAERIDEILREDFENSFSLFGIPNNWLSYYFCEVDYLGEDSFPTDFGVNAKTVNHHQQTADDDKRRRSVGGVAAFSPPLTNRGVTKYLNQNLSTPQLRTNSEVASNTEYIVLPTPEGKWGGFDGGVEVGFEVQWNKEEFDSLVAVLTESRKQAEADTEGNPVYVNVGSRPFVIKPTGANVGLYYKFVLEGCGVKVYIHHNPPKNRQGVRVRYHFESLIRFNLYSLHAALREWLESLGLVITKETVSRVDMQVMTLRKTSDYLKLIINDHAISCAQKEVIYRKYRRLETYTTGSDTELCIYDKFAELSETGNAEKTALMKKYVFDCGGGVGDGSGVTRIEFRLRRAALRSFKIDTITDLYYKEAGLVDWLTSRWFRILEKPKVRGHENTASIHPLWVEVQELFKRYFPGSDVKREPVTWSRNDSVPCDPVALEKQAAGCIASAAALRYGEQKDVNRFRAILHKEIDKYLLRIFDKTNERAVERQVKHGVIANINVSELEQERIKAWERFQQDTA